MNEVTKRTVTCPHCSAVNTITGTELELRYGTPVSVCMTCGERILDSGKREIALSGISVHDSGFIRGRSIVPLALFFAGLFIIFCLTISGGWEEIFQEALVSTMGGFFGILVAFLMLAVWFIFSLPCGIIMLIEDVRYYNARKAFLEREKRASAARCADAGYVSMLYALGYVK